MVRTESYQSRKRILVCRSVLGTGTGVGGWSEGLQASVWQLYLIPEAVRNHSSFPLQRQMIQPNLWKNNKVLLLVSDKIPRMRLKFIYVGVPRNKRIAEILQFLEAYFFTLKIQRFSCFIIY